MHAPLPYDLVIGLDRSDTKADRALSEKLAADKQVGAGAPGLYLGRRVGLALRCEPPDAAWR